MTDRELMQQALRALAWCSRNTVYADSDDTITALRERLAAWNEMDDAIAAGDGTLHDAIDHWQERALKAEALLAREERPTNVVYVTREQLAELYPPPARQEPVAWTVAGQLRDWSKDFSAYRTQHYVRPVFTVPAPREWVGLTDDEIIDVIHPLVMADMADEATDYEIAKAIEAKLREKNT